MTPTAGPLKDQLRGLATLPDDEIDPAEAALLLAALDQPGADRAAYQTFLDAVADQVALLAPASDGDVHARVAALRSVLVEQLHFLGDEQDYDDLDNANLMRVIERRRGLPVTLALIWMHAGRQLGWPVCGLAFPSHFLIRVDGAGGSRAIVDPFHGGRELSAMDLRALLKAMTGNDAELTPEHYAPVSNREILVRLQNNIKVRLLRRGHLDQAVRVVEGVLLFAPDQVMLWREAGLMHMRLGNLPQAIAALEQFVARAPNSAIRRRATELIQDLRGRLS